MTVNGKLNFDVEATYSKIIQLAGKYVAKTESKDKKLLLLDYLINTVLDDVCTAYIARTSLYDSYKVNGELFPTVFFDENGEQQSTNTKRKINVSLAKTRIYAWPQKIRKIFRSLSKISGESFEFFPHRHKSIYYPEINLCHVNKGKSSINAGQYLKKGEIVSHEHSLALLFPHCCTNGYEWYDIHTGDKIGRVADFRFAVVYTLARIRADVVKYGNISELTLRTSGGGDYMPDDEEDEACQALFAFDEGEEICYAQKN